MFRVYSNKVLEEGEGMRWVKLLVLITFADTLNVTVL